MDESLTISEALAEAQRTCRIEVRGTEIGWEMQHEWVPMGSLLTRDWDVGLLLCWTRDVVQIAATYFGYPLSVVGQAHRTLRQSGDKVDTSRPLDERVQALLDYLGYGKDQK